ncbi:ubiquitin specific protease, putative [Plasmodium berghei]|uniref:Ubiquitin specific protease, putative n=2 Tax=Plasmodium berghei TaxID=5821 RepID=A0A509AHY2_PLABA|nr:ubiquitin specific protease, putative [Plasmodium berghei ANKA]CXI04527.1 ubiquitin specific protease, putative [Plasmodium berghei]SCL92267.1 ubiquitin specific protease, putative [Plasmodium berghei]SCM15628.1 ubiquitin specific protease, putative [Plasmodium berghei]SCM17420.1 ubiquitin specific protease, putative [Plasmodium berghei]SCN22715.1 ubiquitin specific protease, putative [Plasmodium berghei]|eukprot:XP_034420225.1 ubiquitin specific protease, putative [Plasmodium berghei ANKA]
MIKSENIPIDNINYNLKIEENDDDNKKPKKVCELINCNDKNMINYIYKDIVSEENEYDLPNINKFNNYNNEDNTNYDINKDKTIMNILDMNKRVQIHNNMNKSDANYEIYIEENNGVITELINPEISKKESLHNIVPRPQTYNNNKKENLTKTKLEIPETHLKNSKNTILIKKTNQKLYPTQENILNEINKGNNVNNGYEQTTLNNKILENTPQGNTEILDENQIIYNSKKNDKKVETDLFLNDENNYLHIFKNYKTYQILKVLNIIAKEHIYTKSYHSDNYAKKFGKTSNIKLNDLISYNDLGINNEQIQINIMENEDDPKDNIIDNYKISNNRMPILKSMNKNEKLIYLSLLKNVDKHILQSINKNIFFLKRIQQYFYRKYIHIKFPNDLDNYYYFINMDWFNKLKKFVFTDSGEFPGEITNYKLYNNENINAMNFEYITNIENFKPDLKEGRDYICINKYMWRFLYYTFKGAPCIKRNSNNIYDKFVPISNNDIPNNNIIYSLESQYIDKLFSLFNYFHDDTINIENTSQNENQIKTKKYFADSYHDLLIYYKLANENPNTTIHYNNKEENHFEKKNLDSIKKKPIDNIPPIISNNSNKELSPPKNNITNKTAIHEFSLNSGNQGRAPNTEVANRNNFKCPQRKGSERANNSDNQNNRSQNNTNQNNRSQNNTNKNNGGQNNASQNNGDQNEGDKNRDDKNSDNQNRNNSDTSQSNSNDESVRKKEMHMNIANQNKRGKPKYGPNKTNNPEIGNMKRECSDGNDTKSTSIEYNDRANNNPLKKNANFKGHKNIENKMNPQNGTLNSNNDTNQNYLALHNTSSKKNSIAYHSSNGNDIYKSCEEYNNGVTSSNGYVTTTETDSKGTIENILKNNFNKKKHQTNANSSSCTNMSSTNSSCSYNSEHNKSEKSGRNYSPRINKQVSENDANNIMNHPEKENIQKDKQNNNMNKNISKKNNTTITYKSICSSDSSNVANSSSYQTKSSNSSNFSIRGQSSSNFNSDTCKMNKKNSMEENKQNENVNSILKIEHPAGIINYSTTCYVNVVMQCLSVFRIFIYTLHNYVTSKFKDFNASSDDSNSKNNSIVNKNFFTNSIPFNLFGNNNKNNNELLLVSLSNKLFELSKMHNTSKVIEINRFLNLLNQKYSYLFECNEQQDCHEFLLLVFDYIHNMMKIVDESVDKNNQIDYYLKKEQSIISDQFLGLIEEKITCSNCEYVNCIYQPIYNLSVNFFKKNTENNLNDNLIEYFKKEEVNSTCEKCKSTKMYRCSYVYKQPKILIVHLIRLLEDGSKIDKPIKFDISNFNIQNVLKKENDNFIEPPKNYDLCGVIVHRGLNSNYGHYICYTKRVHSNGKTVWYKFDDSLVRMVDIKEVASAKAYCLFYESK